MNPPSFASLAHAMPPDAGDPQPSEPGPIEQQLAARHRDARVLVVEDDVYGQEILAEYVRIAGLAVDVAGDGVEALERAGRGRYHLILMDVQMPRMDGLEATRRLREVPEYADTPIIAVTAHAYVIAEQMCRQAGMDAFMTKPIDPALLHATLLEWLDQRAPANASA